jgi:hypothetical protein
MPGLQWLDLQKCIDRTNRYVLLVRWKALLHHFYDPFPTVEHCARIDV